MAGASDVLTDPGMVIEQRTYQLHPSASLEQYLSCYEKIGLPVQLDILGGFLGYFVNEYGALNEVTHMWAYASHEERVRRRRLLAAQPQWQECLATIRPMIQHMQNKIMHPTTFSPIPLAILESAGGGEHPAEAADLTPLRPIVTRAGEEHLDAHSGGAERRAGVSAEHSGADRLWFGKVRNHGGFRSTPHHHGDAETGGYVLKGHARIYFGSEYADFVDLREGDFVYVPARLPHIEVNMSGSDELVWMTTRTPANTVINLPDVADEQLDGWLAATRVEP